MAVKALYDYTFPSADRVENFGDDQLVYVQWDGNPLFCSAACFRAPQAIPFGTFVADMVVPWASSDPDFVPGTITSWRLFDEPLDAVPDRSLAELGVAHKGLLKFTVG